MLTIAVRVRLPPRTSRTCPCCHKLPAAPATAGIPMTITITIGSIVNGTDASIGRSPRIIAAALRSAPFTITCAFGAVFSGDLADKIDGEARAAEQRRLAGGGAHQGPPSMDRGG